MSKVKKLIVLFAAAIATMPVAAQTQTRGMRIPGVQGKPHVMQKMLPSQHVAKARAFDKKYPALCKMLYKTNRTTDASRLKRVGVTCGKSASVKKTPMLQAADGRELYGNVVYSGYWDEMRPGLYSFKAEENVDPSSLWINEDCAANGGGALVDGVFHSVNWSSSDEYLFITYCKFNAETGEEIDSRELDDVSLIAQELAVAYNGNVYGEFYNSDASAYELGVIDYSTMTRSTIGTLNNNYVALGITKDNTLYGVASDGNLYKIDSKTASETLVGATGLSLLNSQGTVYQQSGEIDQKTGIFYWAAIDGDGSSSLYTVDLTTGTATRAGNFVGNEQVFALTIPAPEAEDGAPAVINPLDVFPRNGSLTVDVSFTAPTKTFSGGDLSDGELTYTIEVDGETLLNGTAYPGQLIERDVDVASSGMHNFVVTTTNGVGRSPQAKAQVYVGYDETYPVEDVKATANTATGKVTVTWSAPTGSYNDGYVGDLTYDVTRYPDEVKVAEGISETTFTETVSPAQLTAYTYGVTAVNGDTRSGENTSGKVVLGPALTPPYDNDFPDESSLDLMTVIDNNGDGCTWGYHPDQHCAYNVYSSENSADDWLLTPPIKMEAGKEYAVTFTASNTIEEYMERIEVKYGVGDDPTTFSGTLLAPTELTSKKEFTSYITPDKDQDMRIAFHALSDADMFNLLLFGVHVSEGCVATAPDSVTNITVTPDRTGITRADVHFCLPNSTIGGSALNGITKVEVMRDGVVTISETNASVALTPGQWITLTDYPEKDSTYTYKVVVYGLDGEKGRVSAGKTAFVGTDIPQTIDKSSIMVKDNKTAISLAWDAVTVGKNGGYVNPQEITYNVYDALSYDAFFGYEYGNLLGSVTGDNHLDIAMNTDEGDQQMLTAFIQPTNEKGEGYYSEAQTVVTGAPYSIPFKETFSNGMTDDEKLWFFNMSGSSSWYLNGEADSPDGGATGLVVFNGCGDESYFASGKINPAGAANLKLFFNIRGEYTQDASMTVQVQKSDGTVEDIKKYEYNDPENISEWTSECVSLAKYANERYILVRFLGNGSGLIPIDNVVVRNLYAEDLSVAMAAPESVKKGNTAEIELTVTNLGENAANGYSVKLYDGDELAAEKTVNSTLAPLASETVSLNYTPSIFKDGSSAQLTAEVVYDKDLDMSNNKTTAVVELITSTKPAPASAVKAKGSEGCTVSWTAPAIAEGQVTDSFEDYDTWAINSFGDWTSIDGDKGYTGEMFSSDDNTGHQGEPFAFEIFEPQEVSESLLENNPEMAPYNGNKYAAAFYSVLDDSFVDADNWLISPSLSGKKQTVKFFALNQADSENNYPETLELLYSTTGTSREDFTLVKTVTVESNAWEEISFDVPDGATHFAIRHTTAEGGYMLGIDDVTYEAGNGVLTGYNVYRDGKLISTVSASTLQYADNGATGDSEYAVTAVYTDGESAPTVALVAVGIDDIVTAGDNKTFNVYTVDGKIVAKGVTSTASLPVGIYVVNGQKVTVK